MKNKKLSVAEAERLAKYCQDRGGQEEVAVSWFTSSSRLSRLIRRKCAPQKMFRHKLQEIGVIKI